MNERKQGSVLIVDDIPDNVNVLFQFLNSYEFKVFIAEDGQQALESVYHICPDLILLDVMMPGISGFEVCQRLKSDEKTKDIPIIFMTALNDAVDKVKGFSLGAVDYVTKPFQYQEVLSRIKTHLALQHSQQQLREELKIRRQYAIELERRNTQLHIFARTVAHDLKMPLNAMVKFSDALLIEEHISDKTKEQVLYMAEEGRNMINAIDAILFLAQMSEHTTVETHPLDMEKIITEVVEERLVYMIREFEADLTIPGCWPVAQGYAPWVAEVWANYLSNGLKYGDQPPKLELGATLQKDHTIRFWVRDNGPGLTVDAQKKLFTPFMRLHKDRAQGHGLGLPIVQQIIEKLGGQVGVESELGQGSLFYFTLPAAVMEHTGLSGSKS